MRLALAALPQDLKNPERPYVAEAEEALNNAIYDTKPGWSILEHTGPVYDAEFNQDGTKLMTNGKTMWDVKSGQEIKNATFNPGESYTAVTVSPDGSKNKFTFSPDGAKFVAVSGNRTAKIYDSITSKELITLEGHNEAIFNAAFSPDGKRVITASNDATARIWDVETGKELLILRHEGKQYPEVSETPREIARVAEANFSPDGNWVVTASSA